MGTPVTPGRDVGGVGSDRITGRVGRPGCPELPGRGTLNTVCPSCRPDKGVSPMLLAIAAILFVLWLLGFLVIHVGGALIHLLIVIAVIVVVLHFVRGRGSRV